MLYIENWPQEFSAFEFCMYIAWDTNIVLPWIPAFFVLSKNEFYLSTHIMYTLLQMYTSVSLILDEMKQGRLCGTFCLSTHFINGTIVLLDWWYCFVSEWCLWSKEGGHSCMVWWGSLFRSQAHNLWGEY